MTYPVILFYKHVEIVDAEIFAGSQRALCESLGLKGRILIATEGINGTLAGPVADVDRYVAALRADPRFHDIESAAGKFENAVVCEIEHFRALPQYVDRLQDWKDKTVLMYCTGGIRCEKASTLFKRKGVNNLFQLHGGIAARPTRSNSETTLAGRMWALRPHRASDQPVRQLPARCLPQAFHFVGRSRSGGSELSALSGMPRGRNTFETAEY